jgi:hypothetical protein
VLVDLGDAVAEELGLPFDRISLGMIFRGLYHFIQAYSKGEATDPVKYLAALENRELGVVKRLRKKPDQVVARPLTNPASAVVVTDGHTPMFLAVQVSMKGF